MIGMKHIVVKGLDAIIEPDWVGRIMISYYE